MTPKSPAATLALLCALVLPLAACGQQVDAPGGGGPGAGAVTSGPDVSGTGGDNGEVAGIPPCEDSPRIRAEDSAYRDSPVYGNAQELVEQVQAWGAGRPGYAELWLDRERNGWITVGFTKEADLDELRGEAEQRWPGEGIVLVQVPHTTAELEGLSREVHQALVEAGAGFSGTAVLVDRGVVQVDLGVVTPEVEEVLAGFPREPLCIGSTMTQEDVPSEAPQPTAGQGWRMLGEDLTGEAYRTGVATTDEQLAEVWRTAGLEGAPPGVDWQEQVAVWFGAVYGSGCPVRLDGMGVVDDLLHADLVVPNEVYGCNGDANPHAFVLAVDRVLLPQGPFRVQLTTEDPFPGVPEERTVVDVDLSAPGSTATDEQIHLDEELVRAIHQPDPLVRDGEALPAEEPARYVYRERPGCGWPVIGPFDGSRWRLADREAPWDVTDGEEVSLYLLDQGGDALLVSGPQMDWTFVRLPDGRTCP